MGPRRSVRPSLTIVTSFERFKGFGTPANPEPTSFLDLNSPTPVNELDSWIDFAYNSTSVSSSPTSSVAEILPAMTLQDTLSTLHDFVCRFEHRHDEGQECPLTCGYKCVEDAQEDVMEVEEYIPISVRMFGQWKGWDDVDHDTSSGSEEENDIVIPEGSCLSPLSSPRFPIFNFKRNSRRRSSVNTFGHRRSSAKVATPRWNIYDSRRRKLSLIQSVKA